MTERNMQAGANEIRFIRWRGSHEFLHAGPWQRTGNTHLAAKARQSGTTK